MKKLILLLTIITLSFSCSSDSNSNSNNNNNGIITTINPSNITSTSFVSGGNINITTSDVVIFAGVCYGTSPNPSYLINNTVYSIINNTFNISTGSSLSPNTTYYIRAFVNTSAGLVYGNEINITTNVVPIVNLNPNLTYGQMFDIQGNVYPTIQICNQIWMAKNLNTSKYRNGDNIPQIQDKIQWANATTGAWCYYENDSTYGPAYGKLYNRYAIEDPRGIAPQGWHVPSQQEYQLLQNCLGTVYIGRKLIEAGSSHWGVESLGTNESGFTGIPSGMRDQFGEFGFDGVENGISLNGYFYLWTTTSNGYNNDNHVKYSNGSNGINGLNSSGTNNENYTRGFSLRLIKD